MKTKLAIASVAIITSSIGFANSTVTVDEISNTAPKATIEVEKTAAKEVHITPKLEATKTEVLKSETAKTEPVKIEEIDKELAEINPDVKPEPLPNIFETSKNEAKKETAKIENKIETKSEAKASALSPSIEDSMDLKPTQMEVQIQVNENKKAHHKKPTAMAYDYATYEKPMSASERIRAYRQKMEERNMLQIQKSIEEIRIKQELILAKKLQDSMNHTLKALDNI